jgi:hypothetical protein
MRLGSRWRQHTARLMTLVALSVGSPSLALADTPRPTAPGDLPVREANFAWDENLLRASFAFSDMVDDPLAQKLSSGPSSTIALRAYVIRQGETTPVALAVQTCVVSYDLWDDVFHVRLTTASGTTQPPVANLRGVERVCFRAQDLPVTPRNALKAGVPHFLAVIVDVNPVSEEVRAQMHQWMQRPIGAADVGPGDALFSAFALLLFRDVGGSDRTLSFRTRPFVP